MSLVNSSKILSNWRFFEVYRLKADQLNRKKAQTETLVNFAVIRLG
jgi:hypothetical protein